jgi:hypothetical protein
MIRAIRGVTRTLVASCSRMGFANDKLSIYRFGEDGVIIGGVQFSPKDESPPPLTTRRDLAGLCPASNFQWTVSSQHPWTSTSGLPSPRQRLASRIVAMW